MNFFNAHCHEFTPIPDVVGAVVNATNESGWGRVLALQSDVVSVALGVHPWNIGSVSDGWITRLRQILIGNPRVMVGECGLDGMRPDMDGQIAVFLAQLQIAAELRRPIHIHCVRAWGEIVRILNSETLPPVIVMHAFSGAPETMAQMPENVFYSFSPAVLNANYKRMRASVAKCPENRILIESDDMSASVLPNVAAAVAEIRGLDVQNMAQILLDNSQGAFING